MAKDRPASWTLPILDFDEQRIDSTGTIHPPPTEDERLVPPAALELGEVLGTGGMGEVRLARQVELQRDVAVKLAREERLQRELVLEATITGGLEHPGIGG